MKGAMNARDAAGSVVVIVVVAVAVEGGRDSADESGTVVW